MAKIGLQNFRYGILTEDSDGAATYGTGKKPGKAINASLNINNNSAQLYADDALAESDTSFQNGTITMGIDDEDDITMADMLGHEIVNGEMVRNSYDVAPYLGVGRIITKMVNGTYKYKVEFLHKVKMSEPSQDDTTRAETIEFGTSQIEGQISCLANGDWSKTKTFNTMAEAQEYLDSFFGSATAATVAFDTTTNGGSGSISTVNTYVGATIPVSNGTGITPPTNKHFVGWDTTASATTPDVVDTFKVTKASQTLYAIYEAD